MRILKITTYITAALSIMAFQTTAEILHTDWVSQGDGLVTTDSSSNLEFLKLTETVGMDYNYVLSLLDTTFLGWRVATASETEAYIYNISGISPVVGINSVNEPGDPQWIEYLGQTQTSVTGAGDSIQGAYGVTLAGEFLAFGIRLRGGDLLSSNPNLKPATIYYNSYDFSQNLENKSLVGTFLVRDAQNISESPINNVPAPLALSSLALLTFGLVRRKKLAQQGSKHNAPSH